METSAMAGSVLSHSPIPLSKTTMYIPRPHPSQRSKISTLRPFRMDRALSIDAGLQGRKSFAVRCSSDGALKMEEEVPIEKRIPAFQTVMDINKIREILPHRFPFLLVDRVIEYQPGVTAVAIKNVTINDNFFPGHFPERPIMPGVLTVEALAQVGGIVMLQTEFEASRDSFFLAGVDKVRFRKPVIAGDTLVMRMTLTKFSKAYGLAKMEGKAYVGGELVCEGEFLLATGSGSK